MSEPSGRTVKATNHRLWVNAERTVLIRLWQSGIVEVATRPSPDHVWGPPVNLREEKPGAGIEAVR